MARGSTMIATFTGRGLDLAASRASSICLEDIAAGLSKVCRFGGQSLRFYSVAQHAVVVSLAVQHLERQDLALAALHHDSHEAYTCDVPSPLKRMLDPGYSEITSALDRAIADHLKIVLPAKGTPEGDLIKEADAAVLIIEAAALLRGGVAALGIEPGGNPDGSVSMAARTAIGDLEDPWSPDTAVENFQRMHAGLAT